LNVAAVLGPVIAAVIACNLFRLGAWNFFFDEAFKSMHANVPALQQKGFVVEFAAALGSLLTVAVLALVPVRTFQPYGRGAVAASLLIVLAADAFYTAAIAAPVYFVAGSFAHDNVQLGIATFLGLDAVMNVAVFGLMLFFWGRIALAVLDLSIAQTVTITLVEALGFGALLGIFSLLASLSSAARVG
jgi:hypothetical protein